MPSDAPTGDIIGASGRRLEITTAKVLKVATWEWQPVESVMAEIMATVPSGQALRYYQKRAELNGNKGVKPRTEDEMIASGKRGISNDRIISMRNSGRIELETLDGVRSFRLKENRKEVVDEHGNCVTCHRPFPKATEQDPAPSVPQPKRVLYPTFPSWEAEWSRKTTGS